MHFVSSSKKFSMNSNNFSCTLDKFSPKFQKVLPYFKQFSRCWKGLNHFYENFNTFFTICKIFVVWLLILNFLDVYVDFFNQTIWNFYFFGTIGTLTSRRSVIFTIFYLIYSCKHLNFTGTIIIQYLIIFHSIWTNFDKFFIINQFLDFFYLLAVKHLFREIIACVFWCLISDLLTLWLCSNVAWYRRMKFIDLRIVFSQIFWLDLSVLDRSKRSRWAFLQDIQGMYSWYFNYNWCRYILNTIIGSV